MIDHSPIDHDPERVRFTGIRWSFLVRSTVLDLRVFVDGNLFHSVDCIIGQDGHLFFFFFGMYFLDSGVRYFGIVSQGQV
jgi:hypothetical protein